MSFTPEQRTELDRMIQAATAASVHQVELSLKEGEGHFTRFREKLDELKKYNQKSHDTFRDDIDKLEEKVEKHEPAIEWVRGIRRAWSKILIALIISGLIALASGAMKLIAYFKALPGG